MGLRQAVRTCLALVVFLAAAVRADFLGPVRFGRRQRAAFPRALHRPPVLWRVRRVRRPRHDHAGGDGHSSQARYAHKILGDSFSRGAVPRDRALHAFRSLRSVLPGADS